jgi:mRNA interferase MazF
MTKQIYRGEIYYAELSPAIGSEQDGYRPVLIIQNDSANRHSPTTQIIPITTKLKKATLPIHIYIAKRCGLETDSIALAEQLRTIDKSRIGEYVGGITAGELLLVEKALIISLGLKSEKGVIQDLTLCPRCKSNFEFAGRLLIKRGWQEVKETCDYCQVALGVSYGVF